MTARRHCRADKLTVGTVISVGYGYGPIVEVRVSDQRVALRIEGDSLWHLFRPDDVVFLEPAEHIYALQAERRQ